MSVTPHDTDSNDLPISTVPFRDQHLAEATGSAQAGPRERSRMAKGCSASRRLDAVWFHTDLESVTDHLQLASETDDPAERADHLQAALRQYAGPLAADLDEVWDLIDQRRHWQQTLYQAALELAVIYNDTNQDERAAVALERASAIDPDHPEAWEQLATHHREHGDTAKADEVEARARHRRETARLAGHQTGSDPR